MIAIRNYNDTKIEYNVAKQELERLENKKTRIYCECFNITTKLPNTIEIKKKIKDKNTGAVHQKKETKLKDENYYIKAKKIYKNKNELYLSLLEKKDDITGLSLNEAIEKARNEVDELLYYLKLMGYQMKKLKGIEYQLYCAIVIDASNAGKSISSVVEEFAEKVDKDPQTIWKNYYPHIKKYLTKLQKYSENTVTDVVK